jgi:hypothetical protein
MHFVLKGKSSSSVVAAAAVFFLLVKAIWIILPTSTMGVPRIGDDSLVYLWVGAGSVLSPQLQTPAIQDIISLRKLDDHYDPKLDFARARVTMRTTYLSASPFAVATAMLLNAGLSLKMAFAFSEMIVATTLAAGIALFLASYVGVVEASLGVFFLTFVILPQQGMHYLVPSVLALSLSLLIWANLNRPEPSITLIVLLSAAAALVHSIAFVYIAIAVCLSILIPIIRSRSFRVRWQEPLALVCGVAIAFAFSKIVGARSPPTTGMGEIDFSKIGENLRGATAFVRQAFVQVPLICVLGGVGLALAANERRMLVATVLLGLAGAFLAGTAFNLNGYPGELPGRLIVPIVVVLAGLAGLAAKRLWQMKLTWLRVALVVCIGWDGVAQARTAETAFFANLNGRSDVYSEEEVRADLDALPSNASILWTDPDVSMMVALLGGASRFHSLPFPMIDGSSEADKVLAEHAIQFIAAAVPRILNTDSDFGNGLFPKRFYGVDFSEQTAVASFATSPVELYLRVSRAVSPSDLSLVLHGANGQCEPPAFSNLALFNEAWLKVDLAQCPDVRQIQMSSSSSLQLLGLQVERPKARLNWPWGSHINLRVTPRKPHRAVAIKFDWDSLLGSSLALRLADIPKTVALSDESGIVWIALADMGEPIVR